MEPDPAGPATAWKSLQAYHTIDPPPEPEEVNPDERSDPDDGQPAAAGDDAVA